MTTFTDLGRRPSPRPRQESDGGAADDGATGSDADAGAGPVPRVSDAPTTRVSDAGPTRVSDAAQTRRVSDAVTERHAALWTELPDEFARDRADALIGTPRWEAAPAPFGSVWRDAGPRDDDVSILPGLTTGTGPSPLSGPLSTGAATGTAPVATRSSRRAMSALGVLCALSVGFLGGVVVHAHVARTAGADATALTGQVEASGDGVLSVRGDDGRLTALRTTAGTRVVRTNPVPGALPPGTTVEVESRRDTDGALTATEIQVGGSATAAPSPTAP